MFPFKESASFLKLSVFSIFDTRSCNI
jgi:hypothetical protein